MAEHLTRPVFETIETDIPERTANVVLETMNGLFPYDRGGPSQVVDPRELPDAIHRALAGNEAMRISKAPGGAAKEQNLAKIALAVEADEPIPLVALLGTAKFPHGEATSNEPDVADFGALQTVMALDARVRRVYEPGIRVRGYFEDAVGDWLFGAQSWPAQDYYWDRLSQLHEASKEHFGHNPMHLVREQDILNELGVTIEDFRERSAALEVLFHRYLIESGDILDKHIANTRYGDWTEARRQLGDDYEGYWQAFATRELEPLESFRALQGEQWNGFIPPEMRDFYLKRFENNVVDLGSDQDAGIAYMAHYFGSTLAKSQLGSAFAAIDRDKELDFEPQHALKLSLIGIAPGVAHRYQAAFQMRGMLNNAKRGGVDNCTPPWRSVGGVLVREDHARARANITPTRHFKPDEHQPATLALGAYSLNAPVQFRQPV